MYKKHLNGLGICECEGADDSRVPAEPAHLPAEEGATVSSAAPSGDGSCWEHGEWEDDADPPVSV